MTICAVSLASGISLVTSPAHFVLQVTRLALMIVFHVLIVFDPCHACGLSEFSRYI